MPSTHHRLIVAAVLVCGFAVGMAGCLNFFKYRSTAHHIVADRLAVIGKSVEGDIQASLALGLQFSDIGTLPSTLERARSTDHLMLGIDIFDPEGRLLYSTDRLRIGQPVPQAWLMAARAAKDGWTVDEAQGAAQGLGIQNHFGQAIGHLALRYSGAQLREADAAVGREIALSALLVFVMGAATAAIAVQTVGRRLDTDLMQMATALETRDPAALAAAERGPFGSALRPFVETTDEAQREIDQLQTRWDRGASA